ncbi:hypothetical protein CCS01_08050 [Rhodopila globiformis]|uniref:DUF3313 domain-containing protein n=1 Tax=Rhodopila globiformis TaxID=1071 RepID=A0A2S6NK24_RHOGL|nr:hypothetical protein CCS01_08050 [Rhodopila globiformis]
MKKTVQAIGAPMRGSKVVRSRETETQCRSGVVRLLSRQSRAVLSFSAIGAFGLLLSACTPPGARALNTNVPLTKAPEDLSGAAPMGTRLWRSPELAAAERSASAYQIPPATVYRGRGSYFADLSPDQVDQVAAMCTRDVRAAVGRRFRVVDQPGPGVFRLELVLARLVPPRPQYAAPAGWNFAGPALSVGMPEGSGSTAGTMTMSGKLTDSQNGNLLVAFSSPVSPTVMDLPAPGRPTRALDFADAACEQFADDLVRAMIRQRQANGALPPAQQ